MRNLREVFRIDMSNDINQDLRQAPLEIQEKYRTLGRAVGITEAERISALRREKLAEQAAGGVLCMSGTEACGLEKQARFDTAEMLAVAAERLQSASETKIVTILQQPDQLH